MDDFLTSGQGGKEDAEKRLDFISLHLKVFISYKNINPSSNNNFALLSFHVVGEGEEVYEYDSYSTSYDLTFVNIPFEMRFISSSSLNGCLKRYQAFSEMPEGLPSAKITGGLITSDEGYTTVDISEENYKNKESLLGMCLDLGSIEGINSLENFKS